MQFERIRKSHKKEIIIGGLITLGIVSAITLVTTRAKYKLTESMPLVSGTINYKPYDFKIMAMYQQTDSGTYTEINEMPSEGYIVNEEKTYCTIDNQTQIKGKFKTIGDYVSISNLNKGDKCYLYFDKYAPSITIPDIIASLEPKDTIPDFRQGATTDEGVYKAEDEIYGGTSYYWRGAATTNYLKFAGFCWRIVRINGDGSIRLIYDGATCHANGTSTTDSLIQPIAGTTDYAYNASYDQSNYVGWTYEGAIQRTLSGTASNAKIQTENWFNNNITGIDLTKIDTNAKYCNDRDVQSGSTWAINGSTFYYAGYKRLYTDYQPTLACNTGDVYTLSAGLITADEVEFAGGNSENNMSYYLYNGQDYWTMSPYNWGSDNGRAEVFRVNSNGRLSHDNVNDSLRGLRPVINLRSDITFSDGDGTIDSPYVIS